MRGCLAVCSADNEELGGFKMGGSSFQVCRHFLGTDSDIQYKVSYHCTCNNYYRNYNISLQKKT